ncbi:glycosyltransferase family 2 protein [Neokomagataea anthophila]|uniref:Glycosyltransferase n=1 Tax=Neokomagataea anthophila TaxID=2826925 RepID=A0ABS5E7V3_9PROT|nr:glycosyltransferase family 2 protein [Neokomagataea anthophila]MBR0559891.1 hypothetical protein [Neokomagataea anthophila]
MSSSEMRKRQLVAERKKRGWVLFCFGVLQFTLLFTLTSIQMYINGVSPFVFVPLCGVGALVTSLGGSMFLLFVFGAYAALRPVEADKLNPINYAVPLKEDTRIAILMPIYHEDPARVSGGLKAMMEELSPHGEAKHFDWFVLSDSRNEDVIIQEEMAVFLLREQFPHFNITYRHRISNTFAKVGNTSDFYRRWGRSYKYVIMLDADSILPGESMITLARSMEGSDNTALIQSRFYEVTSDTTFGIVSNFRFLIDNFLYTHYYNYFNPGRGFYMGHNAIVRASAFMEHCNFPVSLPSSFFPGGKMISHDYYEGALLIGAGYETWILPQIISFDQQLHNLSNFYIRERRWLVGAQDWFRFFMSKSLSHFGKINMFQRAIFYYAATIGFITFLTSYYGFSYIFHNPMKTRMLMEYYHLYFTTGMTQYFTYIALVLLLASTAQLSIYYFVLKRKNLIPKMGGTIKFVFSYFLFAFLQSCIMLIAMFLINMFLWQWIKRKKLTWESQDRDGTKLGWMECIKNYYPLSLLGGGIILYSRANIFPYMHIQQFRTLGIQLGPGGIDAFKFSLIFPALVFLFSPAFVRLTSIEIPFVKKMKWLKTPYDGEDLHPVVKKTYQYTEEMRDLIPSEMSFKDAISSPWFTMRHMAGAMSRPKKAKFWRESLERKDINDLTRHEKLTVFRCRELWEMFFVKQYRASVHYWDADSR